MLNKYKVLLVQETWLKYTKDFKQLLEMDNTHRIIHRNDSEEHIENKPGHYPGGLGWIISRELDNWTKCKVIYINERISYLLINEEVAVIGVYLPSNNSNEYYSRISMIEQLKVLKETYLSLLAKKLNK